jgi:hypothetical protein
MAQLTGLINFEGTLDGITSYTRKGKKGVVRKAGGPGKKQLLTGAAFERTRENMTEFAGAVYASKILRLSLSPILHFFADCNLTGRLQGAFRSLMLQGEGARGQRSFKPLQHAEALKVININKELHLDSILRLRPITEANKTRTAVTLSIEGFNTATDIYTPAGATHLELIHAIAILPAVVYNKSQKKYVRADGLNQLYQHTASSELLPVHTDEAINISLSAALTEIQKLHKDSALISVLGIRFYQQVGLKKFVLESGKTMGIAGVH